MAVHHRPVVVGYDFSHTGHVALTRGVERAVEAPNHILHVVCVVDPRRAIPSIPSYQGVDPAYAARVQEALAVEVTEELERARAIGRIHFFVHARIGDAAAEILALAQTVGADLIIVGSHGLTGVERFVLGSTSENVVREARCTVEVARPKRYADVGLAPDVATGPGASAYVPPDRYEYEDHRVLLRPAEWPLR